MSRFHEHVKNRPYIDKPTREWFSDFTSQLIESQLRYSKEPVSVLALETYFTVPRKNNLYESEELNTIMDRLSETMIECETLKSKIDVLNGSYFIHSIKEAVGETADELYTELKKLKSKTTEKELQVFFSGLLNLLSAAYITKDPQKKMMYMHYAKVLLSLAYNFSKRDWSQKKDDEIIDG